ncbi:MAG: glycosyltransferase [Candidatus Lokiarchaeota archaeon]|nr:glycosyltransferase [Candidatus Lokiarchaeota archaeon]
MRLAFFYCFYPKMIVRRVISVNNLIYEFKKNTFDVILSGTAGTSLLYSYIISKLFNIPIVCIAHGDDFLIRYAFSLKEEMFQDINSVIVTNKVMKHLFLKIYDINPNKINIIHLGVNIEQEVKKTKKELRNELNISEEDFVLLSVSRFYPRKGFDTILKSIRLILQETSNIPIKYFIIGGGQEEDKIRSLINELNLQDQIKILGTIEDELKNKYYKLSDVFVLVPDVKKNSIEGFGIVYIEANFFKLPVIGSRSGGVRVAIEENKSGLLINPGDKLDLKEKILELFKDKDFREKLGDYGHQRVLENFDWKTNAEKYHSILFSIVKNS